MELMTRSSIWGGLEHLHTLLATGPLICTYHVSLLLVNPVCSRGAYSISVAVRYAMAERAEMFM